MEEKGRKTLSWPLRMYVGDEAIQLLNPLRSRCVKSLSTSLEGGLMIVECTLPLDVETAVGLQILGDRAVADPDLELTILASLGEE